MDSNPSERFLAISADTTRHRTIRNRIVVSFALILIGITWSYAKSERAYPKYVWTQMLPDANTTGGRLVRAIYPEGSRCPNVSVEGQGRVAMQTRHARVHNAFPILLCEAEIDATSEASVGSIHLPIRPPKASQVLAIGDTGCRMVYFQKQPCLNPDGWPFGKIASASAKSLLGKKDAIIVHVGDFHYREHPCSDANPECGGSPFGDNWAAWEADFFLPAKPLLLAAPWVIVRGNHEDCGRAGAGWLFFFALPGQQRTGDACEHDIESYSIRLDNTASSGTHSMVVFDTANEADKYTVKQRCETFKKWLEKSAPDADQIWLVLHQPIWQRNSNGGQADDQIPADSPCENGKTESALKVIRHWFMEPRRNFKLILSGDTHLFEFFRPLDRPPQLIVGNSGTKLDLLKARGGAATADAYVHCEDFDVDSFGAKGRSDAFAQHGFTMLSRTGNDWTIETFDSSGKVFATYMLNAPQGTADSAGCREEITPHS